MTIANPGGVSAALAMMSVAAAVHGQNLVLHVDDDAPAGGDGASWAEAFNDLQLALNFADRYPGTVEIRVAEGVYRPDRGTMDRRASFKVRDVIVASGFTLTLSLALLGGFGGVTAPDPDARDPSLQPTILSGDLAGNDHLGQRSDNSNCVVSVEECDEGLVFDGLTISGGHALEGGAGGVAVDNDWYSNRGGPLFRNCKIVDNQAGYGTAGVRGSCRRLTFERCVVARNTGLSDPVGCEAGGVRLDDYDGMIVASDSRFVGNAGYRGGALSSRAGLQLQRCIIAGNRARREGGGILAEAWGSDSTVLENCLFVGNSVSLANGAGGAVSASGSTFINNCTFTGNFAAYGAGVFATGSTVAIANSILFGNAAEIGGDALAVSDLATKVTVWASCIQGWTGGLYGFWFSLWWEANTDADPIFRSPLESDGTPDWWERADFRLMQASPCVDRGHPGIPPAEVLDLDGLPRFVGNSKPFPLPDMGCYELQTPWCPADFNGDGYTDGLDADSFNNAFESGDLRADVNRDSYVDGLDYEAFVESFERGCT